MKPSAILIVVGVLLILGGAFAFANPLAASLAITTLVGVSFLLAGVLQAWAAFQGDAAMLLGGRVLNGLWALMGIIAGVWLLANPLEGVVSRIAGVVIGVLIFGNIMEAATTLLGLLLAIELFSQGIALLLLGVLGRKSGL